MRYNLEVLRVTTEEMSKQKKEIARLEKQLRNATHAVSIWRELETAKNEKRKALQAYQKYHDSLWEYIKAEMLRQPFLPIDITNCEIFYAKGKSWASIHTEKDRTIDAHRKRIIRTSSAIVMEPFKNER